MTLTSIILKLHEIGAVQFGSFQLKDKLISPIFIDLRLCISYPKLLGSIADQLYKTVKNLDFDLICGVPYTALPIATAISLRQDVPMIMRRKEMKDYGTKKPLEGSFQRGQRCLIIEDIVTSGASILETIDSLENEGLKVTDAVVLVDREQGAEEALAERGYELHRVFTLSFLLNTLHKEKILDPLTYHSILDFLHKNKKNAS
jgi:uridine monophosphate synthetase